MTSASVSCSDSLVEASVLDVRWRRLMLGRFAACAAGRLSPVDFFGFASRGLGFAASSVARVCGSDRFGVVLFLGPRGVRARGRGSGPMLS